MKFISENLKFPGMIKEKNFLLYPCSTKDETLILQSDTRIVRVYLYKKTATISKAGRKYNHDLHPLRGAKDFDLDEKLIEKILMMKEKAAPSGHIVRIL